MQPQSSRRDRPVVLSCQTRRMGGGTPCCGKRGAPAVLEALRRAVADARLDVEIAESPCLGHCSVGPNLRIVGDALYHHVTPEDLGPILERLQSLAGESPAEEARPMSEILPPV